MPVSSSAQRQNAAEEDLKARFDASFFTRVADTSSLIQEALALRFQVYCVERKFEDPDQHPDGFERDEYDDHSIHTVLLLHELPKPIGTARLIMPRPGRPLPIEELLEQSGCVWSRHFPAETTAEVSRFLLSKTVRNSSRSSSMPSSEGFRDLNTILPCLGLVQALVRSTRLAGMTHWAAVMDPKLLRMLASLGVHFSSVGSLVSHHGLRQPSYCAIDEMLNRLLQERPQNWRVVTNDGEFAPGGQRQARSQASLAALSSPANARPSV